MSTDRIRLISSSLILGGLVTFGSASGRAEGGDQPPAHYASLPGVETPDRDRSGNQGTPLGRQLQRGAIILRPRAPLACLPGNLRLVIADVAARFGSISVESTHRSRGHNGRAGGARHSLHLSCRAVDLRVRTRVRGVMAYLRSRPEVGGLKMYRTGIIHIDNGERRSW
jgi:hypothetical protein